MFIPQGVETLESDPLYLNIYMYKYMFVFAQIFLGGYIQNEPTASGWGGLGTGREQGTAGRETEEGRALTSQPFLLFLKHFF